MPNNFASQFEARNIDPFLVTPATGENPAVKAIRVLGHNADIDIAAAEDVHEGGGDYPFLAAAELHEIVSSSVEDGDDANAATGTITYGTPVADDTVEVAGTTFTYVAAAPGANEFSSIAELTALIQALATVNATDDGTTITVVAATAGAAGNAITLALGGANAGDMAVSGATLTGGDDANSTGALTVRIVGLNSDFEEVTEDVSLNGTTLVLTDTEFIRINSMEVLTVGSNGSAVGNITATAETANTVTARILAGDNKANQAVYTVPVGRTAFVLGASLTTLLETAGVAMAKLMKREFGKGFVTEDYLEATAANNGETIHNYRVPVMLPAKCDVKLRVSVSADNTDVAAGMEMLLV